MQIRFLGTGTSQGVPIIACNCQVCISKDSEDKRLRSSILIQVKGMNIVIDAGPDFRQQMLASKLTELSAILITHAHRDHLSGLDDIRGFNFKMRKPIDVYCEPMVAQSIKQEFHYAFQEPKYPGVPEMNLHLISDEAFELKGIQIQPIRVQHHLLPVLGFRFGNFAYITDANFIADKELEKLKGVDTIVLNALRHEKHISHFTLEEAILVSQKIGAKRTFFTHISHQLGKHSEVQEMLPENMFLASDGLMITVN
jgi:phosphoribosyl 1,2-cyclic phosphate phosphodiesterase